MNRYLKISLLSILGILFFFSSIFAQSKAIVDQANAGDPDAQFQLALLYYYGEGGVVVNPEKCEKWALAAAEQGHAEAQDFLGQEYAFGDFLKQDDDEAYKWFKASAEQGYAYGQWDLGNCYYYGVGVDQDFQEAFKWYEASASQGNLDAYYSLGVCYGYGDCAELDYNESANWFLRAAQEGHADSQYNIGFIYYEGIGVKQDKNEGIKWIRKAADQVQEDAVEMLHVILNEGITIPGKLYTFDEKSNYEISSAKGFKTIADADNSYGTFVIIGKISDQNHRDGVPSYDVTAGNAELSYRYFDDYLVAFNNDWHFVRDDSQIIDGMTLSEDIRKGALILQISKDHKSWTTVFEKEDMFQKDPVQVEPFYVPTNEELAGGCFYRAIIVYEIQRKTDKGIETKKLAEVNEFYLLDPSSPITGSNGDPTEVEHPTAQPIIVPDNFNPTMVPTQPAPVPTAVPSVRPTVIPTVSPTQLLVENGEFTMPQGTVYTLPDDDAYIFKNALTKRIITDGYGNIGTFYIEGEIYNDGEKNGFPSYYVDDDELIIRFQLDTNYITTRLKKQGWEPSDDLAKSINGCKLVYEGEEYWLDSGALAVQVSGNGKDWITYDFVNDWLDHIDQGDYYEFTPDPLHLDTGCYYRIVFAYELKKEKVDKKFLGGKYDYANYAEAYEFYLYNEKALEDVNNNQQFSLGKKIKTGDNFFGEETIGTKDKHYGWDLGNFFISGYTEHQEINGSHFFLKNVGDEITLWFNLSQDINALNGSSKLKIKSDKKITDQHFELTQTNFYRGALIIRYTDYQNITHDPVVYTDFLEAYVFPFANTKVELFEEGDYEVALDYSIDKDHYRIAFNYSIRNSNCMVYPFDVVTRSEMVNSSYTDNGFYLDLARSRYLDINVKRVVKTNGIDDVRFNRSARDGEEYRDEGEYIITVKNKVTGEQTEKRIYVGENYRQYSNN